MNKKYLRKEDIKSGMLVEYCGELCLVVGSTSGLCLCGMDHCARWMMQKCGG